MTGEPGPGARRRAQLTAKVLAAHTASDGVNGAPRILADLRADGETVSHRTVAKLMQAHGIVGISPATWRPVTTISDGTPHTIPDLVERDFDRGRLAAVWTPTWRSSRCSVPRTRSSHSTPATGGR